MKMAVPCPAFTLCKQIPHLVLESRKVDLRSEKLDGDLGEDGFERVNNLGLLLFFFGVEETLQWSFGLLGTEEFGVVAAVTVVRHRRLGLDTG